MIHALVVDDDPLVITTLTTYFNTTEDIRVHASATNGTTALELFDSPGEAVIDGERIDIILADIHMPSMDGITLLKHIQKFSSPPPFLAITSFDTDRTMLEILKNGGAGYILKAQRPQYIIDAVRQTLTGGTVVSPEAMGRLVQYIATERGEATTKSRSKRSGLMGRKTTRGSSSATQSGTSAISRAASAKSLADADRQVLELLCLGYANGEIAEKLSLSESLVKKRVSGLIREFGASSRLNLVTTVYSKY